MFQHRSSDDLQISCHKTKVSMPNPLILVVFLLCRNVLQAPNPHGWMGFLTDPITWLISWTERVWKVTMSRHYAQSTEPIKTMFIELPWECWDCNQLWVGFVTSISQSVLSCLSISLFFHLWCMCSTLLRTQDTWKAAATGTQKAATAKSPHRRHL